MGMTCDWQIDTPAADMIEPERGIVGRKLPEELNATWGLDMLDQDDLPLDGIYHYTYNGGVAVPFYSHWSLFPQHDL
jgi:hypothetical protein